MTTENTATPDDRGVGAVSGSGKERTYTTKEGDTLEDLAAFFYGDAAHRQRLIDDNPDLASLAAGDAVPAGTRLNVGEDAERGDTVAS